MRYPPPPPKGHMMNKINYNIWEDIASITERSGTIRNRQVDPKKIEKVEAMRKVILGCSSDGGEIGSTGRNR